MRTLFTLKYYLLLFQLIGFAIYGLAQNSQVNFSLEAEPDINGYRLGLRGSLTPLSWDKTIYLNNSSLTLQFLNSNTKCEYKYVLDNGTDVKWEGISNRELSLTYEEITIKDVWNKETPVDISSLEDITSEDLYKDYKLLEEMVLRVHPGTYRYQSEIQIKRTLDELKDKFESPLSLGEAYAAMSKLTAAIHCDHTKVGFNNQSKYVNTVIHEQPDKLPFTFKWFDDKMIIDLNATDLPELKRGAEVLTINNIPVSKIRSSLLPFVAADGATDRNRIQKLEVDGFDFRYNAFDVFYPLKFPLKDSKFKLRILDNGVERDIEVKGIHREKRAKVLHNKYQTFPYTRDEMWRFEIKGDMGILKLNSFGLLGWKAMTLDYKMFLKNAFTKMKTENVQNLVIDIRKNTGGMDEMKKILFTYLSFDREDIKPISREGRTRFTKFPESLKPYVKTWGDNPWYYNLEPDDTNGIYYIFNERMENRKPLPPRKEVFLGNVFLLIGPSNTSLAYYTARDFKHYKIGKLIGEETGGNMQGINGGQILFLVLPNSGIEIDFPVMGDFSKNKHPNSGVLSDYHVVTSLEDFRNGTDAVMDKVRVLIVK